MHQTSNFWFKFFLPYSLHRPPWTHLNKMKNCKNDIMRLTVVCRENSWLAVSSIFDMQSINPVIRSRPNPTDLYLVWTTVQKLPCFVTLLVCFGQKLRYWFWYQTESMSKVVVVVILFVVVTCLQKLHEPRHLYSSICFKHYGHNT